MLLAPCSAVFLYPTLREGFVKTALAIATFHVTLSIVSQALHVFSYPYIISVNIIFSAILISVVSFKKKPRISIKTFKSNWIFIVALLILSFQLYSVHQSYTGIVQTMHGQESVLKSAYPYPFFSDEWVTVSLINYSIENNALPLVNTFDHNVPFSNILFAFPSVLAELFLVTGLSPLVHYWIFAVIFGLVICSSLYILLKVYGVNKYIALAGVLLVPYILNSGNLPSLWCLLPFTLATMLFIWQLISQKLEYNKYSIFFSILILIIYPPMIVFSITALFVGLFKYQKTYKKSPLLYLIPLGICLVTFTIIFYFVLARFDTTIADVFSRYIIRPNLDPSIISYALWNILPIISLITFPIGIYVAIRNKYYDILIVLGMGILYWFVYVFLNKVIIIEYPRIVFITSLFLIAASTIGLNWLIEILRDKNKYFQYIPVSVGVLAIVLSVMLLPSYTSGTSWKKLTLTLTDKVGNSKTFQPASPVNRYLTDEDLFLFKNIYSERFIAPPWKGLVIGVATGNFPLETKSSTITSKIFPYAKFMSLNCNEKKQIAQRYKIGYVYSDMFSCPGFYEIGSSTERLYLYQYK